VQLDGDVAVLCSAASIPRVSVSRGPSAFTRERENWVIGFTQIASKHEEKPVLFMLASGGDFWQFMSASQQFMKKSDQENKQNINES
jgi:hypothetical protein